MALASFEKLLFRIINAVEKKKKITFLFGSGLTMPAFFETTSYPGVLNANSIVDEIEKSFFGNDSLSQLFNKEVRLAQKGYEYQNAMKLLLECNGQDELNTIIHTAVLNAYNASSKVLLELRPNDYSEMEKNTQDWYLRPGVDKLGQLVAKRPDIFSKVILTSNFDPLIEIAIKKHGGFCNRISLSADGSIGVFNSDSLSVVHFHGYWYGTDTLHTPDQLTRLRPMLKGSLRTILQDSIVIVLAYGGWNDMFTQTLFETVKESSQYYDLLWTFYEDSDDYLIEQKYQELHKQLNESPGRIVQYKGVNVDLLFTELEARLCGSPVSNFQPSQQVQPSVLQEIPDFFPCDTHPINNVWSGRSREFDMLNNDRFSTFFITGFGGQGKSGLASQYLTEKKYENHDFEFWDWRDFKEEDNRFHSKLVGIIERITLGDIRAYTIAEEKLEGLIEIFFRELQGRKILFVFDNVDKYIDLEEFKPINQLKTFLDIALRTEHKSKFIFTCRPKVRNTDPKVFVLELGGVDYEDAVSIFDYYHSPLIEIEKESVIREVHSFTNGHPLWLNLIAAQGVKGRSELLQIIKDIRNYKNESAVDLASNTLSVIWKSLNRKQQILLRGLSEMIRAETVDNLVDILKQELNRNQFIKSLNSLKKLNLVVIKEGRREEEEVELHPLVKQFIVSKYGKTERSKYITYFVNFYNNVIIILKPSLDGHTSLSVFEKFTNKIELDINNDNFKSALNTINEITTPILSAGFIEEFLRVCEKLFHGIDLKTAVHEQYPFLTQVIATYAEYLAYFGRIIEAHAQLEYYLEVLNAKSTEYVDICVTKCYIYWIAGDFKESIDWGEKASALQKDSNAHIRRDIDHTLALVFRDTREPQNIERALKHFLRDNSLESVLNGEVTDQEYGSFYGNIGRCLQFIGKTEDALKCYHESFRLLYTSSKDANKMLNLGYACQWIGECMIDREDFNSACLYFKLGLQFWEKHSPFRASSLKVTLAKLLRERNISQETKKMSPSQIEKTCLMEMKLQSSNISVI